MANGVDTDWRKLFVGANQPNYLQEELTPEEIDLLEQGLDAAPIDTESDEDLWTQPLGMGDSLLTRSSAPQLPAPIPPMGMAESLFQRSGDALPKIESLAQAVGNAPEARSPEQALLQKVTSPSVSTSDVDSELSDAQSERNRMMGLLMMMRGSEKIGTSIAGVQSDKDYLKELIPMAESKVGDVVTKQKMTGERQEQLTRQIELGHLQDANNPKGRLSQLTRQFVKEYDPKFNVEEMSHAQIKPILGAIANQAEARLARDVRLEAQLAAAETKGEKTQKDKEQTQRRFVQGLRKEATTGQYGKLYGNLNNAQKAAGGIEQFMKNPTGYSDYATLMSGLKALQGDESVVREAEIRLGMEAGSFKEKITNQVDKLRSGKSLQPTQRKNILRSVQILKDITSKQYLEGISPILEQARDEGVDPRLIIPGNLSKESSSESGEVERKTNDGRIAIFDTKTKKFIRYKDK